MLPTVIPNRHITALRGKGAKEDLRLVSASSSFLRLILSFKLSASRLAAAILACICSPDISFAIVLYSGATSAARGRSNQDFLVRSRLRVLRATTRGGKAADGGTSDRGKSECCYTAVHGCRRRTVTASRTTTRGRSGEDGCYWSSRDSWGRREGMG